MNAYYDKTFVIGSEFIMDIRYLDDNKEPIEFDSSLTVVDVVFKNLDNKKVLRFEDVGRVSKGRVYIEVSANKWDLAEEDFFKDDIIDLYGEGGKHHSYGVWLKGSFEDKLCVLRGKAKMVRSK